MIDQEDDSVALCDLWQLRGECTVFFWAVAVPITLLGTLLIVLQEMSDNELAIGENSDVIIDPGSWLETGTELTDMGDSTISLLDFMGDNVMVITDGASASLASVALTMVNFSLVLSLIMCLYHVNKACEVSTIQSFVFAFHCAMALLHSASLVISITIIAGAAINPVMGIVFTALIFSTVAAYGLYKFAQWAHEKIKPRKLAVEPVRMQAINAQADDRTVSKQGTWPRYFRSEATTSSNPENQCLLSACRANSNQLSL